MIAVDSGASGSIFRGIALAHGRLYVTDFHNGRVLMYDSKWRRVVRPGAFHDPQTQGRYTPHGIAAFGNRAESLANLLRKGTKVFVDGRLEARPWTGNDGALHAGLEVVANEVELCSPRQQDDGQQMRPTNTVNRQRQGTSDDSDLESLPF